jgi:hypothetical protein
MASVLKPENELIVSATSILLVLAIFANTAPNVADVRGDEKGNVNTHKATKLAAITAGAAVGSLALLSRSPTVMIVGGGTILFETWKLHFANYGANGTEENATAPVT